MYTIRPYVTLDNETVYDLWRTEACEWRVQGLRMAHGLKPCKTKEEARRWARRKKYALSA